MRIGVYGAGASGGHFAVRLALAGNDVSVVARGETLAAIRQHGLVLVSGEETLGAKLAASDDPAELGEQDLVLVTTKATALGAVARGLTGMVGPGTRVVFLQNGMPWWYRVGLAPGLPAPPLPHFALEAEFLATLAPRQIIGGVIYSANEAEAPGRILNLSPNANRIDIGAAAPEGETDVAALRVMLEAAGLRSPEVTSIRAEIWHKLLINMSGSALALVTGSRSSISRQDQALGEIYRRLLGEGLAIAAAHGFPLNERVDAERMRQRLLDHKPSLLQDFERGRTMEIGEILLAPREFAREAGLAIPTLEAVAAIAAQLARGKGLVPELWQ
jgi:2-dehydropantoate 2-reductase